MRFVLNLLIAVSLLAATKVFAQTGDCFTNHGLAVAVSEMRSMNAAETAAGRQIVLAVESSGGQSSLLVIDAESGETDQFWYPDKENAAGGIFSRLLASSGKYYLMFGDTFVEFDPDTRKWTFEKEVRPKSLAMSYAEASDGAIFVATYPRAELYRFDPKQRSLEYLTQLDPSEKYPSYLAVGDDGWVYSGLGTVHSTLVAYHPESGERRQIYETVMRSGEGTGMGAIPKVIRGTDDEIYAEAWPGGPWLHLSDGDAVQVDEVPEAIPNRSAKWSVQLPQFPQGGEVKDFSLGARSFELVRPDGSAKDVTFDYDSRGAGITALVVGPAGQLYGGTSHPLHFFRYHPQTGDLKDFGGIRKVPGGNFPAYAVVDGKIYGAAYVGGHFYEIDPADKWTFGEGDIPNPRLLESFSQQIGRPRVVRARGSEIIIGGFPGYGDVGGGLAFYDLQTGESTLIPNRELLKGHSTITLRVLENGNYVGGTSMAAPGGADPIADQAALFVLDGASKRVLFSTHPVKDAGEIAAVELGTDDLIYGLSGGGQLFTFDPASGEVVQKADLSAHGRAVRTDQSLRVDSNGDIYILMTEGILRVDAPTSEIVHLATPPVDVRAGIGLLGGKLYFASRTDLWSFDLKACD